MHGYFIKINYEIEVDVNVSRGSTADLSFSSVNVVVNAA